eukprot:scaffold10112_cov141-Ochromonas_danica.AAC.1
MPSFGSNKNRAMLLGKVMVVVAIRERETRLISFIIIIFLVKCLLAYTNWSPFPSSSLVLLASFLVLEKTAFIARKWVVFGKKINNTDVEANINAKLHHLLPVKSSGIQDDSRSFRSKVGAIKMLSRSEQLSKSSWRQKASLPSLCAFGTWKKSKSWRKIK